MKKMFSFVMALLILFTVSFSVCETLSPSVTVSDKGLELSGSVVHYPEISGIEDCAIADKINAALIKKGQIEEYTARMALLMSSQEKVSVSWQGSIVGNIMSVVYHYTGAIIDKKPNETERYISCNIDISTGEEITLGDLFTAVQQSSLLDFITENIAEDVSPHAPVCEISEISEDFRITEDAVILYYPMNKFTTLNEKAGKVKIYWNEFMDDDYKTLAEKTSITQVSSITQEKATQLMNCCRCGFLPGFEPFSLSSPVKDVISQYPLSEDPDLIADGRILILDDGEARGIQLVTDRLTESFDNSTVNGIRLSCGNICGLTIGKTTRSDVISAMGEAQNTVAVDADLADVNRITEGTSDYYTANTNRLRLNYDENDILTMIWLMK